MENILITGATGFVAKHVAAYLQQPSHTLYGISRTSDHDPHFAAIYEVDLLDADAIRTVFQKTAPTIVYHLAAQSHVGSSFKHPWETLENNIKGTLNLLEALRGAATTRVMMVSSAEVYGQIQASPVSEQHPTYPNNPYGVSKMTQELLSQQYIAAEGLAIYIARPFNHIGAGQSHRFAIANFAAQIARMEKGQQSPILEVGNLAAERDFTDVRDTVRAYDLILSKGRVGEPYNIGSGKAFSIRSLVDMLIEIADIKVSIQIDEARLRPIDVPRIVADASKIYHECGWQPRFAIEQTIRDILADARQSI